MHRHSTRNTGCAIASGLLMLAIVTHASVGLAQEPAAKPTPFDQGRVLFSLSAGGGSYGGNGFFSLGAGVGYYVLKGLALKFNVNQWFGSNPNVTRLSPTITYVITQIPIIHPYLGFLYRHWFTWDGFPDHDSIGGRGGVYLVRSGAFAFNVGVVYEAIISTCAANCDAVYPEIGLSFSF